jgi:PAS domain S-box-containing protein
MITGKHRLALLMVIMITVTFAATGIALHSLYQAAFWQERDRLLETVQSRARLMEAIARHDLEHAPLILDDMPTHDPREATLAQVREAHEQFEGFGQTGEYALAHRDGDQIVYLLRHRHTEVDAPDPIPFVSSLAEPMRRALSGESGWLVGPDYRGVTVLAAYEPVEWTGMGIVAKIDLAEIRTPFIRAGLLAGLGALILVLIGAILFRRIGTPLVRDLGESEQRLRILFESAASCILLIRDWIIQYANPAMLQTFGYTEDEMVGQDTSLIHVSKERYEEVVDVIYTALRERGSWQGVWPLRIKGGDVLWMDNRIAPMPGGGIVVILNDVTERTLATEEIQRAWQEWENIFQALGHPAVILDPEHGVVAANSALLRVSGLSHEEILGKRCWEIFHGPEHDGPSQGCPVEALRSSGAGISSDIEVEIFGGIYMVSCTPVLDDEGRLERVIHIATDVTDLRRAEEALRVSEKTARSLLNATHDAAQLLDAGGIILDVNESMTTWIGMSREEMIGSCVFDLFAPEEAQARRAVLDRVVQTGEAVEVEDADRGLSLHTTLYPLRDAAGQVSRVGVFIQDITERKQAVEALGRSERFLQGVFESIQDGISVIDRDLNIVRVNRWMREMYSHRAPLEGKKCYDAYQQRDTVCPWCPTQMAFETGETQRTEVPYPSAENAGGWIDLSAFPLRDEKGEVIGVIECVKDITERKRAEEALRESEAQLMNAQRLAHLGNWFWDVETGEVTWSDEVYQIFGVEPDDFRPHIDSILALFHPDDRLFFDEVVKHARDQPGELIFQARISRPGGDLRYLYSTSEGIHDEQGNLARIVGTVQDITDVHRAEEALRESEERLRLALMAANQGLYDLNVQTGEAVVSPEYALMLGFDPAEFVETNEDWGNRLHPDDRDRVMRIYREYIRGERDAYQVEYRQRTASGDWKWILSLGKIVEWDDRQHPVRMLGTHTDITEHKRAEEALQRSEALLSETQRITRVGGWEFEVESGQMTWTDEVYRIHEFPIDPEMDHISQSLGCYHPEDRSLIESAFRRAVAEGEPYDLDVKFITAKGRQLWIRTNARAERRGGETVRIVGNIMDITESKRAEQIRERMAHLARSLAETRDLRDVGRLLAEESRRLLGHDAFYLSAIDERSRMVRGVHSEDTLPGSEKPVLLEPRPQPIDIYSGTGVLSGKSLLINRENGEETEQMENLMPLGDKGRLSCSLIFVPLIREGIVIGIVSAQSYTPGRYSEDDQRLLELLAAQCCGTLLRLRGEEERRKLEEKIQQTQKMESLGVLAGGIAHDFNNLLMGILGNANLALDEMPAEAPARYSLQQIEVATRRAADLTKQMLAYSGKGRFVVKALDLSVLVEEMLHMMQVSISKKAVLKLNLTERLPAIRADATQIRQIVMNLITNASEAIGDRSGIIAITTGAMECDQEYLSTTHLNEDLKGGLFVTLEVSDTGVGMSAETQARIFDPFFTTKFTGRGLGLAAVLGIVRGHHGAIKVYSEPGRGTTFNVLFPASEDQAETLEGRKAGDTKWKGSGTILVADDEETIRALARRILEKAGFDVITAEHGLRAVEAFRERAEEITAVLLDMTMPHMDGEQVFRELRRIRPDVCVILSSGYNEQDATRRFSGTGLAGFIHKPYSPAELIAKIREVLGK